MKVPADQLAAYCAPSAEFPCAAEKKYFGRGPMQLSWNYNVSLAWFAGMCSRPDAHQGTVGTVGAVLEGLQQQSWRQHSVSQHVRQVLGAFIQLCARPLHRLAQTLLRLARCAWPVTRSFLSVVVCHVAAAVYPCGVGPRL